MATDRYTRPDQFMVLYERYRLDDMIAYENARAKRSERRNRLSQLLLLGSLTLVVASDVLGKIEHGQVKIWVVTGTLFAAVSLALGIGMIAFRLGRRAGTHRRTAAALTRMRTTKPGSAANLTEMERWIWQTEAILSSARSDVEPLLGGPPPVPN